MRLLACILLVLLALAPAFAMAAAANPAAEIPQSRAQIQLSFAPVVKKAAPAVVNIYASKKVRVQEASPFLNDPFFGQFFNHFALPGRTKEQVSNSLGSGVIVDASGLIITNNHVIGDSHTDIKVVLADRREFPAEVVMTDKRTDLALLKVKVDEQLPFLSIADPESLQIGDLVLAVGNPFGVGQTVTSGIVSALARTTVGVADYEFFIQTDAAINPGNSGGALIDMDGNLVGINTAIFSNSGGSLGIGFATPANMAQVVLLSYKQGAKRVVHPWLGAATQNITREIAESLGLAAPDGALIKNVFPGGAAEKAGIKTGDVITAIDGKKIQNQESLKFQIGTKPLGSEAVLTLLRAGKTLEANVPMEAPAETTPRDTALIEGVSPLAGAIVENLSPALADELGITRYQGVIVTEIQLRTEARRIFQPGDIILSVNGKEVKTVKELQKLVQGDSKNWKIQAQRGGQVLTIQMTP